MGKGLPYSLSRVSDDTGGKIGLAWLNSSESITTQATPAIQVDLTVYQTLITTGDTDGSEPVTLGDGTGITIGHRKLIYLVTRTGTDTVTLDHANILALDGVALQAAALDAADEFLLVEWTGAAWQAIWANCTLTDA